MTIPHSAGQVDCQHGGRPHAIWRGLLVSVRTAAEARDALAGGAAIIDVKEPSRGPLGAGDADVAAAVAAVAAGIVPWTLACGELRAAAAAQVVASVVAAGAPPPAAAKAGPAGLTARAWGLAFGEFARGLPAGVEPIAVAYADWRQTEAPDPLAIIDAVASAGCRTLLFDTGDKSGPGLLAAELATDAARWIVAARRAGLVVAAAGRLTAGDIPRAIGLGAHVVALRGAVCRGGRAGVVERKLVRAAATLVSTTLEPDGFADPLSHSGARA
jgi:uncharacterized protein (UPF0264 family)